MNPLAVMPGDKKITALDLQGLRCGGDSWTRTNDPIDVNDVLYRLSHATVYINYDGYATYSMTFKPKAKVGLMTAGWTSCFHDGMPLAFFC